MIRSNLFNIGSMENVMKLTGLLIPLLFITYSVNADMAPDGSYVSGRATMAPDGSYVGGSRATMAPDGSYVGGGRSTMAPDGSYLGNGE